MSKFEQEMNRRTAIFPRGKVVTAEDLYSTQEWQDHINHRLTSTIGCNIRRYSKKPDSVLEYLGEKERNNGKKTVALYRIIR